MKKSFTLLFLMFLATALLATSYAMATTPVLTNTIFSIHPGISRTQNLSSQQGITGRVTIANVSPICSVTGSVPSTGPDLVVSSSTGMVKVVALSWTLQDRCELVAPFQVTLAPGTYSLTLLSCNYLGCRVLPVSVVVVSGLYTPVKLNIVTGIY